MKTESNFRYVAVISLKLLVITVAVAVALAAVNSVTGPKIAAYKEAKLQAAISTVLPGGGEAVAFTDDTGLVSALYQGENGWAVEVNPSGYGGTITMMVGIDPSGAVQGISVVSHAETAGLGAVAAVDTSAGQAFRGQFLGQKGDAAVTKDGGGIDAITGATITSRAVCRGVNAALACIAKLG